MTGLTAIAGYVLVGTMLCVMAARVAGPFGQRRAGRVLFEYRLGARERLLLHRTSIYTLGLVLLAGALTGALPRTAEFLGVLGALSIVLGIPAVYVLTDEGVGLNGVVFRRWEEFDGVGETRGGLRITGRPTLGDFRIVCPPGATRSRVQKLIADLLTSVPAASTQPATPAGAQRRRRNHRAKPSSVAS